MKSNKICPLCLMKKFFVPPRRVSNVGGEKYDNGVAKTPPMGWSSWNCFRNRISEDVILGIADAMVRNKLIEAGYQYLNLDDCWQSSERTEDGKWQGDHATFPSGIPFLVEKVNAMGLKLGLYSSNGTLTCEDMPASLGREKTDARTLAEWGVEYFKYDFCHHQNIPSEAPLIALVEVGKKGEAPLLTFSPDSMHLEGMARVRPDKNLIKKIYVSGLDAGSGSATLENVVVAEEGEYYVNLVIKKHGEYEKYLVVDVNGKQYPLNVPSAKPYNYYTNSQTTVWLNSGNNVISMYNPVKYTADSEKIQYQYMGRCLIEAVEAVAAERGTPKKPIVFSICEWGVGRPYTWGATAGNLWRTFTDIRPIWPLIFATYRRNVKLWKYSSIGAWNDPDMLEVGNGKLTADEGRAHFALWCMMASPLILGNDLRKMQPDGDTYRTVTNKNLIAIDQDALGLAAKPIKFGKFDVIARPLADGSVAVCILNCLGKCGTTSFDLSLLCDDEYVKLPKAASYTLIDQWTDEKKTLAASAPLTVELARHSVAVYKVIANK